MKGSTHFIDATGDLGMESQMLFAFQAADTILALCRSVYRASFHRLNLQHSLSMDSYSAFLSHHSTTARHFLCSEPPYHTSYIYGTNMVAMPTGTVFSRNSALVYCPVAIA